jgi:RimJ/RimL family protein N-acetyltransferase
LYRGGTIYLDALDEAGWARTREWMNDPELSWLLGRARPVSDREHEQWMADTLKRSDCVFFAIRSCADDRHIGNVWLWDIEPRHRKAELRIVLGERSHQGRGAGVEAIRLTCRYAFERLNLHKVYAYVLGINPRARRAFEKAGFQPEGLLRQDRWVGDHYADVHLVASFRELQAA